MLTLIDAALIYLKNSIIGDERIVFNGELTFAIKADKHGNLHCSVSGQPISWRIPRIYNSMEIWVEVAKAVNADTDSPFTATCEYEGLNCVGVFLKA